MTHFVIQFNHGGGHCSCGVCGQRTGSGRGPHLFLAEGLEPVCRECGKKHAPALLALLDLARAAERVGRIGRHMVTPPMTALLDLAHAAEAYASSPPPRQLQAVG